MLILVLRMRIEVGLRVASPLSTVDGEYRRARDLQYVNGRREGDNEICAGEKFRFLSLLSHRTEGRNNHPMYGMYLL